MSQYFWLLEVKCSVSQEKCSITQFNSGGVDYYETVNMKNIFILGYSDSFGLRSLCLVSLEICKGSFRIQCIL